ncbi:MAG: hypothetical protein ACJ8F7_19310 [Gemmataceae bacterium]
MVPSPVPILLALSLLAPAVAARARQDAVKSVSIRFKRTEVSSRSGVTDPPPGSGRTPAPVKVITTESTSELVVSGDRYHYVGNHPLLLLPAGRIVPQCRVMTFDGIRATLQLSNRTVGTADLSSAFVIWDPILNELRRPEIEPIWLTFRSAEWSVRLVPTGVIGSVGGARTVEYAEARARYWLEPAKGYVVRRKQTLREGQVASEIDIDYRADELAGWVPVASVRREYSAAGKVELTTRVEVLELRFNGDPPASTFEPRFTPGMTITDQGEGKNYRIAADGRRRELGPDGNDLPEPPSWSGRNRKWFLRAAVAVAVLVLAWLLFRRRSSSRK